MGPICLLQLYTRITNEHQVTYSFLLWTWTQSSVTILCITCSHEKMCHALKWAQKFFQDIVKTSSNLDTCSEAASQGDFPVLASEINGILLWFNTSGTQPRCIMTEYKSCFKDSTVQVCVTFMDACTVLSTTGLRLLGTTTT